MNNTSAKYFVTRQQCIGNSLFPFYGKIEYLYIADIIICANNSEKGTIIDFPWKHRLHQSAKI
jgi:hypothetical protein